MGIISWIKSKLSGSTEVAKPINNSYLNEWKSQYEEVLRSQISKSEFFNLFANSPDVEVIRPDFKSLSKENQISVFVEFFKQLSYFESGWDPNCQNVDVGTKSNPDSWSIGLLQLSVIDQANYGLRHGYTFKDLLNPTNNLNFGVEILCNQIKKRGKIFIPNHETGDPKAYFATLRPGNRYEKIAKITAATKSMVFDSKSPEPSKKSKSPFWFWKAKEYEGKKETDPEFNKFMSAKWPLVGLNLGTIKENWAAWCGLAIAVSLSGVGYDYQKNGALARNWDKYGQEINWRVDGIPQGAIVRINHNNNCNSESSNHVSMAEGDCTSADLLKYGSTITLYGGNQGNTWKQTDYSVKEICAVRWPSEDAKPGKVLKSVNCSKSIGGGESTR